MSSQSDNMDLSPDEMRDLVDAEDKKLSGVKFQHSPEVMKKIQDSLKHIKIVEVIEQTSQWIETWEMHMDDETARMWTANKNGIRPLCNDGSVYFGLAEELNIICQLNGVPCQENAHRKEHWLMRKVHPTWEPWFIYDNNGVRVYGPFADAEEGEEFARDQNFTVEGVWRAQ